MIAKVDLGEEIDQLQEPWSPLDIARVNDQVVRLALLDGKFHWHKHSTEDELFYVVQGRILIQLEDQADITLDEGQMVVIPRGVMHCPKSLEPAYVLLFEPAALQTQGD
jgi:mannose-6-phosphate isomerase-like protein (cupin superfamily)